MKLENNLRFGKLLLILSIISIFLIININIFSSQSTNSDKPNLTEEESKAYDFSTAKFDLFSEQTIKEREDVFKDPEQKKAFLLGFNSLSNEEKVKRLLKKNSRGEFVISDEIKKEIISSYDKEKQAEIFRLSLNERMKNKKGEVFVFEDGSKSDVKSFVLKDNENLVFQGNKIGVYDSETKQVKAWLDLDNLPPWLTDVEFEKGKFTLTFDLARTKDQVENKDSFKYSYDSGSVGANLEIIGPDGKVMYMDDKKTTNPVTSYADYLKQQAEIQSAKIKEKLALLDKKDAVVEGLSDKLGSVGNLLGGLVNTGAQVASGLTPEQIAAAGVAGKIGSSMLDFGAGLFGAVSDVSKSMETATEQALAVQGFRDDKTLTLAFAGKGTVDASFDKEGGVSMTLKEGATLNQGKRLINQFFSKDGDLYQSQEGDYQGNDEASTLKFDSKGNMASGKNFRMTGMSKGADGTISAEYIVYGARKKETGVFFYSFDDYKTVTNRVEIDGNNLRMFGDSYKTFQTFKPLDEVYVDQKPANEPDAKIEGAGIKNNAYIWNGNSLLKFDEKGVSVQRDAKGANFDIQKITSEASKESSLRLSTGDWGSYKLFDPKGIIVKSREFGPGEVVKKFTGPLGREREIRVPFTLTKNVVKGPFEGDIGENPDSSITITNVAQVERGGLIGFIAQRIAYKTDAPLDESAQKMEADLDSQYDAAVESLGGMGGVYLGVNAGERLLKMADNNGYQIPNRLAIEDQLYLGRKILQGKDAFKAEFKPLFEFMGSKKLGYEESVVIGNGYMEVAGERFTGGSPQVYRQILREIAKNPGQLSEYREIEMGGGSSGGKVCENCGKVHN